MAERIDVGDVADLEDGDMLPCRAGETEVVVCRVAGVLYALEDLCSHADTTLSDGLLSGFMVTCPLHGAQFDVRDGSHSGPPAYTGVACFEVDEIDGRAVVTIPDPDSTNKPDHGSGYLQTR
jgi:3-phenylpropionate/trans-cinnamate dioxygenase ferredoxin component